MPSPQDLLKKFSAIPEDKQDRYEVSVNVELLKSFGISPADARRKVEKALADNELGPYWIRNEIPFPFAVYCNRFQHVWSDLFNGKHPSFELIRENTKLASEKDAYGAIQVFRWDPEKFFVGYLERGEAYSTHRSHIKIVQEEDTFIYQPLMEFLEDLR